MESETEQNVFDVNARGYDAWYETPNGRALLATEVAALAPLLADHDRPFLEVGAGTGRFTHALGIDCGLDPSLPALAVAQQRGVSLVCGVGEALPFRRGTFGAVLLAFTLCFVEDPLRVMEEVRRILKPGGGLVLGLLLKGTPWADYYAARGAEGHPIYRTAHFNSRQEIESLLDRAGFHVTGYASTLFQPPGQATYQIEQPVTGFQPGAGVVALAATPANDGHDC
jgi:SAM-dependent methyltransferase